MPNGLSLSDRRGSILGGTIGHILGEQMGGRSKVLEHNACGFPFTQLQTHPACTGELHNIKYRKPIETKIKILEYLNILSSPNLLTHNTT